VYIPSSRSEVEIESKGENYLVRIYLFSEDPEVMTRVEKVVYQFGPDLPYRIIQSTNFQNNFECKVFSKRSFEFEFLIYTRNSDRPHTGSYTVNISRSDDRGFRVPIV
jgi:hypothetical protein